VIGLRYTLTSLGFLLIGFLLAPVIVHLSSKDVIHSSALPQMRVKQDAIPGIEQRLWFTPTRTGEWENQLFLAVQPRTLPHARLLHDSDAG